MNLNQLKVRYAKYDLNEGFFWVKFLNGKYLQCCLIERKDGKGYRRAINRNDNGHDWGICRDVNGWAKATDCEDYEEFNEINNFLMRWARRYGLQVL